jgi:hypothetical protein
MMLPGSGTTGKDIATTFTGLATRGPAAGVTVVFPNGVGGEPAADTLPAVPARADGRADPPPVGRHPDPVGHGGREAIISAQHQENREKNSRQMYQLRPISH